ncbi:hypothetical protein LOTGIDRAFT_155267 [Lottia gigantea]|uniref:Mitochondrial cardiolipin hydrolase n=1 Tax=Lottia gigantea TaxID=225164 RepID=V4B604_LOTGI|nr:hypothetical protein LOTGIDRAFT_155267 [Lottia gigantea]ESO83959.1 hypothetical protein LOTGIDRAFT_155267 [Lottia gigantea]
MAKETIDASVFCLTCIDLADILIMKHKRGVIVRVMTDDEQIDSSGAQIWRLRQEGISVRTDRSSYLMHHKSMFNLQTSFIIEDNKKAYYNKRGTVSDAVYVAGTA